MCLQEIKASLDQLPFELRDVDGYWSFWHGEKGYSGVALLVSREFAVAEPSLVASRFDFEQRIAAVDLLAGRRDHHRRVGLRAQRRQGLRREAALPETRSELGGRGRAAGRPWSCAAT